MTGQRAAGSGQRAEADLASAFYDLPAILALREAFAALDPAGEPRAIVGAEARTAPPAPQCWGEKVPFGDQRPGADQSSLEASTPLASSSPQHWGAGGATVGVLAGSFDPLTNAHVALAQAALDASVPYARERKQFGRPIGSFQGVAFMIADMATETEAARQMVYRAAWLKDQGREYSTASAQAKLFASEVSQRVTNMGVQVHGGYGYVEEYKVERFMRDAKLTELGEGTSQIQRLVIGRRLLGLRVE